MALALLPSFSRGQTFISLVSKRYGLKALKITCCQERKIKNKTLFSLNKAKKSLIMVSPEPVGSWLIPHFNRKTHVSITFRRSG